MDSNYQYLSYIFAKCSSTDNPNGVTVPETVTKVKITQKIDGKLSHFTKLEELEIVIPDGSITLPTSFCAGLTNLKYVNIDCDNFIIGDYGFENCSTLQTFDFESCTSIGSYAFYKCTALEEVIISEGTLVGSYAFADCTGLEKFDASAENISLGTGAGKGCYNLTFVGINTEHLAIQTIKYYFPSVSIPSHNNYSCCLQSSLKEMYINGDDTVLDDCLNYNSIHLDVLSFGATVNRIFPIIAYDSVSSLSYSTVKSFTVDPKNEKYCVYNGCIYTKDLSQLIWEPSN